VSLPSASRKAGFAGLTLARRFVRTVFTLYAIGPLFDFLGSAVRFFFYLAAGCIELRSGLAVELFDAALDFLGRVFGLVFDLTAGFARSLVGMLLIGVRATG
jgi:hypothetical protein